MIKQWKDNFHLPVLRMILTSENRCLFLRKGVPVISFFLVVFAVSIAVLQPEAKGYEINIYASIPIYFWLLLVLGLTFLYYGHSHSNVSGNNVPVLAVFVVTQVALLSVPMFRGYLYPALGDGLYHLGYTRYVLDKHNFIGIDIYPAVHGFASIVTLVTGEDLVTVAKLSSIIPSLLLSVFILLFALYVLDNFDSVLIIALGAGSGHIFNPTQFAYGFVPMLLYISILKLHDNREPQDKRKFILIFLVALITIGLSHPLVAVVVGGIIAIYLLYKFFNSRLINGEMAAFILFALIVSYWYSGFRQVAIRALQTIPLRSSASSSIGSAETSSLLATYLNIINQSSPQIIDLFRIFLFKYGFEAILFSITMLIIFREILNFASLSNSESALEGDYWYSTLMFLLFILIAIVALITTYPISFGRFTRYAILFAVIIFITYRNEIDLSGIADLSKDILTILLVILIIFGAYNSPIIAKPNPQVTESNAEMVSWHSTHSSYQYITFTWTVPYVGISLWQQGYEGAVHRTKPIPPHFNSSSESWRNKTGYVMTTKIIYMIYPTLFPGYESRWRYKPADFNKLRYSDHFMVVYDNGESELHVKRSAD